MDEIENVKMKERKILSKILATIKTLDREYRFRNRQQLYQKIDNSTTQLGWDSLSSNGHILITDNGKFAKQIFSHKAKMVINGSKPWNRICRKLGSHTRWPGKGENSENLSKIVGNSGRRRMPNPFISGVKKEDNNKARGWEILTY